LHLIFIGAPGSGKGTQAEKLKDNRQYCHVSTGDLLRAEVAKVSELGIRIKSLIDEGSLVDDRTVLDLFKNNLNLLENNYIIDGYPRTLEQCGMLDSELLAGTSYRAIYFQIDEEKVVDRIVNRRIAPKSGKIYNLMTDPPQNNGVCDISGEALVHRDDDKEEVVRNRLNIYKNSVSQILDYYRKQAKLLTLDASASPELVYKELINILR